MANSYEDIGLDRYLRSVDSIPVNEPKDISSLEFDSISEGVAINKIISGTFGKEGRLIFNDGIYDRILIGFQKGGF